MKKRLTVFILMLALITAFGLTLSGCGGDSSSEEASNEPASEQKAAENTEKSKTYGVGDTWEVDGQWKLTIDSVETTDERNEFEESDPAQVVVVKYHYENIGYEDSDGVMDGLFFDLGMEQIIDAEGNMSSEYPLGSIDLYAQETPVGATCEAASAIGLKTAGNELTINVSKYDGNDVEQKATFKLSY